jgi:hypothetical protein
MRRFLNKNEKQVALRGGHCGRREDKRRKLRR